ncbi:type II toxin-antitoxin system RelE/ParE family toxin [Lactobacillus sp. XV13L]|nr:type II toxin-antitoxin system RelE/ParE family toxin [Lactobacillus sp. XV13L]
MSKFSWKFSDVGFKKFRKLDKSVQKIILKWLETHIQGASDVRIWGKALEGNLQTYWRYRVGKYRILAEIHDQEFVVLVVKVAKRNDIYKK